LTTEHYLLGFDGLFSPPHLMLTGGMLVAILGALIGIYRLKVNSNYFSKLSFIVAYAVF
jgi:ABC-type branched-subunit amino acid transport system permease subunit